MTEGESSCGFRLINLDALVRMKLTSFRRRDQKHLLDLLDVGLIDVSWLPWLPTELVERHREIIEDPEG